MIIKDRLIPSIIYIYIFFHTYIHTRLSNEFFLFKSCIIKRLVIYQVKIAKNKTCLKDERARLTLACLSAIYSPNYGSAQG